MKISTAVMYTLVTLSFIFSLTALIIVSGNNYFMPSGSSNTATPTTTPLVTNKPTQTNPPITTQTPTPTQTPDSSDLSISFSKQNEQELDIGEYSTTMVNYTINLDYQGKNEITVDYSEFYLELTVTGRWVGMPNEYEGPVYPVDKGSVELGPSNTKAILQLTFEFPSAVLNYSLYYSETAILAHQSK
jgi:hypothetical protein